jgi:hypothetical protein
MAHQWWRGAANGRQERAWLFVRGTASLRFTWASDPAALHIAGPGERRETHQFASLAELLLFQLRVAADLRAQGWQLATGAAERRHRKQLRRVAQERRVN